MAFSVQRHHLPPSARSKPPNSEEELANARHYMATAGANPTDDELAALERAVQRQMSAAPSPGSPE